MIIVVIPFQRFDAAWGYLDARGFEFRNLDAYFEPVQPREVLISHDGLVELFDYLSKIGIKPTADFVFHDDDRVDALLFKLTFGGK